MSFKLFLEGNAENIIQAMQQEQDWVKPDSWLILADAIEDEGGSAGLFREAKPFLLDYVHYAVNTNQIQFEHPLTTHEVIPYEVNANQAMASPRQQLSIINLIQFISRKIASIVIFKSTDYQHLTLRSMPIVREQTVWDKYDVQSIRPMSSEEYDAFMRVLWSVTTGRIHTGKMRPRSHENI